MDVGNESIGLVMAMFTLPGIIFIPIAGFLSDRYGRRQVIVPMLFLYGIASGLTVFAPNYETLLVLRFLAGIGGGGVGTLSLVLVADMFKGRDRAAALAYRLSLGQVFSVLVPPIVGALLIFGWQVAFLVYLLAIPVGLVALRRMPNSTRNANWTMAGYVKQIGSGMTKLPTLCLFAVGFTLTTINHGINVTYSVVFLD